jgi:hypothetical protein
MHLFDIEKAQALRLSNPKCVGARIFNVILNTYITPSALCIVMNTTSMVILSWLYGQYSPRPQEKVERLEKILTALELCISKGLITRPEGELSFESYRNWHKGKKAVAMIYKAFDELQEEVVKSEKAEEK